MEEQNHKEDFNVDVGYVLGVISVTVILSAASKYSLFYILVTYLWVTITGIIAFLRFMDYKYIKAIYVSICIFMLLGYALPIKVCYDNPRSVSSDKSTYSDYRYSDSYYNSSSGSYNSNSSSSGSYNSNSSSGS